MKVVYVSGLEGSGKTTLIRTLIEYLWQMNCRAAVIVNESGEAVYDAAFLERCQAVVEYVRGG